MTTETTAPSLSDINPLIAYEDQPDETAENVRDVLNFMAEAIGQQPCLDSPNANGARLILATCASALDFHLGRREGASN